MKDLINYKVCIIRMIMSQQCHIASLYIRECFKIQYDLACKIRDAFRTNVYIYDLCDYFVGAEDHTYDGVRFKVKSGSYGVLSLTTQSIIKDVNIFKQFQAGVYLTDAIGCYIQYQSRGE